MTATNPTLILVHGAFHTPMHYAPLLDAIAVLLPTLTIAAPALPTMGRTPAHAERTRHDDVAAVASAITVAADKGDDVVVLMHSYGGVSLSHPSCGSEAYLMASE
jgi:pimeloyl-ACP methyl ester carboxylesterase